MLLLPKAYLEAKRWKKEFSLTLAVIYFCLSVPAIAQSGNSLSPVMMNLAGVANYVHEYPFINMMKNANGWNTKNNGAETGEEPFLNLDANGYPINLKCSKPAGCSFNEVAIGLATQLSPGVTTGTYIVLYDGAGTIIYTGGATKNTSLSSTGRDVISISSTSMELDITATDPQRTGNYIRNIRILDQSNESGSNSGQIFNPNFLNFLSNFRAVRFMDWSAVNGNTTQINWSQRRPPNYSFWAPVDATQNPVPLWEVPYETDIALLNQMKIDGWFNIPIAASNDYITQIATLVHNSLNTQSRVYVELSNEVWNTAGGFTQSSYAAAQGQALWGSGVDSGTARYNWYGMRAAQMCQIWKNVWGSDFARVTCVLSSQIGGYDFQIELACSLWTAGKPCTQYGITAVAVAPYVSENIPDAWTADADGGLNRMFTQVLQGGLIPSGAGAPTTTGSPTNYKLTSGLGLSGSPPNGTVIAVNFNQSAGANPTISVDNMSYYPIVTQQGVPGNIPAGIWDIVWTTATNGGSVSPQWRLQYASNAQGSLAATISYINAAMTYARQSGMKLIGYESGQSFTPPPGDNTTDGLYVAAQSDTRMGQIYASLYNAWRSAGGDEIAHYNDIGTWMYGSYWGLVQNSYPPFSGPKYNAVQQFINSNPCWWNACSGASSPTSGGSSPPNAAQPNPLQIWFVMPSNGATLQSNSQLLVAVGTLDSLAVKSIVIEGDGKIISTCTNKISCAAVLNLDTLSSGAHQLAAVAMDVSGNQASASASFQVK